MLLTEVFERTSMLFNRIANLALSAALIFSVVSSIGPAWCGDAATDDLLRSQQLKTIESQLLVNPSSTTFRLQHAEILGLLQRFDEAIAETNRVIAIDSKSRDAYLIKAHSLGGKKQFVEAVQCLDEAFKLGAPSAKQLLAKGSYLKRAGRYPAAVSIFSQVIKTDPGEASAYMHRSYCYQQIYGPTERSLRDLEIVARLKPEDQDVKDLIRDLRTTLRAQNAKAR
jgi:tetratricopeptide (TPR) repeat protein